MNIPMYMRCTMFNDLTASILNYVKRNINTYCYNMEI